MQPYPQDREGPKWIKLFVSGLSAFLTSQPDIIALYQQPSATVPGHALVMSSHHIIAHIIAVISKRMQPYQHTANKPILAFYALP